MTHAKRSKRWSYSAGERGRNRVRAFEHAITGRMFLEFSEPARTGERPQVRRVALGHRDKEGAKAAAEKLAAELRTGMYHESQHITLAALFDIYMTEVTPSKGENKQRHDRACAEMFLRAFGRDTEARTLSRREWDRFIRDRRSGVLRPGKARKRAVGNRVIAYDLAWLRAVLAWGTMASDGHGGVLLDRNPLAGLELPREANPRRPVLADEAYEKLRAVAADVSPAFELALVLARETGHRLGSIRHLRWSDVDTKARKVRWRAETDKIAYEHTTPLSEEAAELLERERRNAAAIGGAWIFPDPATPDRPRGRDVFYWWWEEAERRAGLEHEPRRVWHSLRRSFATALRHRPLKDLCALGGWKDHNTVLTCYIQPDEDAMREALADRRAVGATGTK